MEDPVTFSFEFEFYQPEVFNPIPESTQVTVVETGFAEGMEGVEDGEGEAQVRVFRKNFRTTVCRHWLRGLCVKGTECDFLHQFDESKMPVCRFFAKFGECKQPDCQFRHSAEGLKECNFYKMGFCYNGPYCKFRHVKKTPRDLPLPVPGNGVGRLGNWRPPEEYKRQMAEQRAEQAKLQSAIQQQMIRQGIQAGQSFVLADQ